jgi:hypothetical protein
MSEKRLEVNNGKGLYDNAGVCDTLIRDLNRLPKMLMDGQYIQFCDCIASLGKRIANLKEGIQSDTASFTQSIEDLKRANENLMQQLTGQQTEKAGADNGND